MKKPIRKPKYREKILEFLVDTRIHPSAELIYNKLKRSLKGLSLATVQRSIRTLKEEGRIWELDLGKGPGRFSAAVHFHYHFICSFCQNIYDLRIPPMRQLDEKVMEVTGFRILSHRLAFFGVCDVCKLRNQKKNKRKQK